MAASIKAEPSDEDRSTLTDPEYTAVRQWVGGLQVLTPDFVAAVFRQNEITLAIVHDFSQTELMLLGLSKHDAECIRSACLTGSPRSKRRRDESEPHSVERIESLATLSESPEFLLMESEHVLALAKRTDIGGTSDELFRALIGWVHHDRPGRCTLVPELVAAVGLPLVKPTLWMELGEGIGRMESLTGELQKAKNLCENSTKLRKYKANFARPADWAGFSVGHTESGHLVIYRHTRNDTCLKEYRLPMDYHAAPSVCVLSGKVWFAGGQPLPCRRSGCRRSPRVNSGVRGDASSGTYSSALHSLDLDFNAAGELVLKKERAFRTRRICAAMAELGSRIFLCGGVTPARRGGKTYDLSSVEVFDVGADTWREACDLPSARRSATAVTVHRSLFLIGGLEGCSEDEPDKALDEILRYDEDRNTWEVTAHLRWKRHSMGCGVDRNRVYLVGGCDWNEEAKKNEPLDFVECFDAATGELRTLPSLPEKGYDCGVRVVDGVLQVFGGSFGAKERSVDSVFQLNIRIADPKWTRAEVTLPEPCDIQLSVSHVP